MRLGMDFGGGGDDRWVRVADGKGWKMERVERWNKGWKMGRELEDGMRRVGRWNDCWNMEHT